MRWKFFIPAEWEIGARHTWEDVWLMPVEESYDGESIWLTIDGLKSAVEYLPDELTESAQVRAGGFVIDGTDMLVGVEDFSRDELLVWVRRWLEASDFTVTELAEGTFEDFRDTNDDAKAIVEAEQELKKIKEHLA